MASTTIAFGPGVIENNPINSDIIFNIQARNTIGLNRKSGRDLFFVKILKNEDAERLLHPPKIEVEGEEGKEEEDSDGEEVEAEGEKKKEMLNFDQS